MPWTRWHCSRAASASCERCWPPRSPSKKHSRDGIARLGAKVKIRHADGETASYQLVSPAEADPRRGRISEESPIGRALVGRKKNEEVTADTPSGPERLVVLDVA